MEKSFQKNILVKWFLAITFALMTFSGSAKAADYSAEELDTLVATIALYPDPLLAHVLTASTHNDEIPSASLWANAHKGFKGEALTAEMQRAGLDYDASVLALIPFPTILATMAKYSTWTSQLGRAVKNQNGEVMFAVQRMRHAAYDHGNLNSDQYIKVERDVYITIEPVKKEYIYVPVYNPSVVYYVHTDRYVPMHYGHVVWTGYWYNDWVWGDTWFEWHSHTIRHHPRPPRPRHHYNAQPPRHGGHSYAPAPSQPQSHHRLPVRETSPKPSTKPQPAKQEQQRPTYTKIENVHPQEEYRPVSNPQNLTRNKKTNSSQSSTYNDDRKYDDRRNGDDRSRESNSQGNGGFRRSIRR
ncbi:DUF3300 domain-containing protein [Fibrobacter sp. UWH3]|uniref:DUF3300 domain-containing protein n=1 Tax=Fibrobacter sp. UWH3 TaxID=1964353 RepID=UPI000B5202F7|nr:DUF3300 domain-containing protein [Fibrobacter sp. UWH3]OWV06916.1 hypothetical protein B7993_03885 [Fibrobacter sp. UWH3]